jgi:hypothetical protein
VNLGFEMGWAGLGFTLYVTQPVNPWVRAKGHDGLLRKL